MTPVARPARCGSRPARASPSSWPARPWRRRRADGAARPRRSPSSPPSSASTPPRPSTSSSARSTRSSSTLSAGSRPTAARSAIDHYAEGRDAAPRGASSTRGRSPTPGGSWYLCGPRPRPRRRALVPGRPHPGGRRCSTTAAAPPGRDRRDRSRSGRRRPGSCSSSTPGPLGRRDLPGRRRRGRSTTALRVTLAVGGRPWLERLLLRLGPAARVVDGPDRAARRRRWAAAAGPGALPATPTRACYGGAERGRPAASRRRVRPLPCRRPWSSPCRRHAARPSEAAAAPPSAAPAGRCALDDVEATGARRRRRRHSATRNTIEWVVVLVGALVVALVGQDLPRPGLLHPVRVDGAHAPDRRPGAGQQAQLRPRTTSTAATSSCSSAPTAGATGGRSRPHQAGRRPAGRDDRGRRRRVSSTASRSTSPTWPTGADPELLRRVGCVPSARCPRTHVFVMGDNREQLRRQQPLRSAPVRRHVVGRAFVRVWPLGDLGGSVGARRLQPRWRRRGEGVDHAVDVVAVDGVDADVEQLVEVALELAVPAEGEDARSGGTGR